MERLTKSDGSCNVESCNKMCGKCPHFQKILMMLSLYEAFHERVSHIVPMIGEAEEKVDWRPFPRTYPIVEHVTSPIAGSALCLEVDEDAGRHTHADPMRIRRTLHTHSLSPTCVHPAQFQPEPDCTCLCGGQIEIFGHTGAFIAGCKKCKKHGPWLDSVQQAEAWIREYGKEAHAEVIGECYGAVPPSQKEGEHI